MRSCDDQRPGDCPLPTLLPLCTSAPSAPGADGVEWTDDDVDDVDCWLVVLCCLTIFLLVPLSFPTIPLPLPMYCCCPVDRPLLLLLPPLMLDFVLCCCCCCLLRNV